MKQRTFLIIEKDGYWLAVIRRINVPDIELDWLEITNDILKVNGQSCSFTGKGGTVVIAGKTYYKPEILKKGVKKLGVQKSLNQIMREDVNSDFINDSDDYDSSKKRLKFDDIFSLAETKTPSDVRVLAFKKNQVENFYLKLNKFARYIADKDKFFFFKNDFNSKKNIGHKHEIHENYGNTKFDQICKREKNNSLIILQNKQDNLCENTFSPQWRLVIGLGSASVYETGMTLHHIYGFPYIPASSIKGVLRNYIINTCFNLDENEREEFDEKKWSEKKEEKALTNPDFKKIFGSQDNQGEVIFFDAFPLTAPKIEVDIMTPHYGDYYSDKSGGVAPTDTQSPNPIPFLTVVDTNFQFLMGSKKFDIKRQLWEYPDEGKLTLKEWLQKALTEHGIGAKTAVGYGYMTEKKI